MLRLLPSVSSWSAAAGRYGSAAMSSGLAALLHDVLRELRGGRRLARALEAHERDDGRAADEPERPVARRQERGELVVDDLHDLLAGGQALEDLGADRALAHAGDEVLDDLEVDVGLEQREADLAHRGVHVGLGHATTTGQPGEGLAEAIAEVVEHAETATLIVNGGDGRAARPAGGARVLATPRPSECSRPPVRCRPRGRGGRRGDPARVVGRRARPTTLER